MSVVMQQSYLYHHYHSMRTMRHYAIYLVSIVIIIVFVFVSICIIVTTSQHRYHPHQHFEHYHELLWHIISIVAKSVDATSS